MCWRKMRTHSEWKVQMVGRAWRCRRPAAPWTSVLGSSLVTRSCISRAALLVKVTARMWSGGNPASIMWAMRKVITRVLPVPAPARIKTGPRMVSTAWRCCGLRELRSNIARGV